MFLYILHIIFCKTINLTLINAREIMLSRELFSNVKRLEIKVRRLVDELTAGAYHSVFKGKGIDFCEVREYEVGDDVRDIDWNVTARMGKPFIKKFIEDKELNIMLLVDASGSTMFGGVHKIKYQQIIEIAALLALSAIRNNNRVGLLIFTDKRELYVQPRAGRRHGLRLIRELMSFDSTSKSTNIKLALTHTINSLKKRSVVFLLSDFMNDINFTRELRILNKRHDMIAIRVLDTLEHNWEIKGKFNIEDIETGQTILFNSTKRNQQEYSRMSYNQRIGVDKMCNDAKVDLVDIVCGEDIANPIVNFFKERKNRKL